MIRDKPDKALLATRIGYESLKNFDTFNTFATELFLQNKLKECAHVYLEGALSFATNQLFREVDLCINQIRLNNASLDLFEDDEKLLFSLLETLMRLKKSPLPLG